MLFENAHEPVAFPVTNSKEFTNRFPSQKNY